MLECYSRPALSRNQHSTSSFKAKAMPCEKKFQHYRSTDIRESELKKMKKTLVTYEQTI